MSTLASSTSNFRCESIQLGSPEAAESVEPDVRFVQRRSVDGVDPPRPIDPHRRKPAIAKHFQLLRDGGLGEAELLLDGGRNVSRRVLSMGQQLQNASANRIGQHAERVHQPPV